MFSTAVAVVSILVLVLPGFVIADLQRRKRASVTAGSDWDLVLRALSYSLILHLAVAPWTRSVVLRLQEGAWADHLTALMAYGAVVLVIAPALIGLALSELLLRAERSGELKWWHYALGGRDELGTSFLQRLEEEGRWIVVKLKDGPAIGGKLGRGSWASQSPASGGHDIWIQEIWTLDSAGRPALQIEPRQGMWAARDEIESLFVIEPPGVQSR